MKAYNIIVITSMLTSMLASCERIPAFSKQTVTDWRVESTEAVLQTIAMESANQPARGQALVALTIINRARIRHTTPEIEALRPFQYSAWNRGGKWAKAWLWSYWGYKARKQAILAYSSGLAMASKPKFQGIRHYHTKAVHPGWARGQTPCLVIGDHKFYKDIL